MTTLETVVLPPNTWRLSSRSKDVRRCPVSPAGGDSACVGGSTAGVAGEGYCRTNHSGPLCQVCSAPDGTQYFDEDEALCVDCPVVGMRVGWIAMALAGAASIVVLLGVLINKYERLGSRFWRLYHAVKGYALMPMFKILIATYQAINAIPFVYDVSLPPEYHRWMRVVNWVDFDWSDFFIPGSCLPGGFLSRLLLRGLAPFGFILTCVAGYLGFRGARRLCGHGAQSSPLRDALSVALFLLLCFCASVSSGIFMAWNCVRFEDRTVYSVTATSRTAETVTASFLRSDLTVKCDSSLDPEYAQIRSVAAALVALWPVAVPISFLAILFPIRRTLARGISTPFATATSIIHREYRAPVFYWESIYLLQRIAITGFVQWIPYSYAIVKLQFGLILTITYLCVLIFLKPYQRRDLNFLAIMAQVTLLTLFMGALNIKLHEDLTEIDPGEGHLATRIMGFASSLELAAVIFSFNMLTIVLCFASIVYQMREDRAQLQRDARVAKARRLRYVDDDSEVQPPPIAEGRFHLFLSHVVRRPPPHPELVTNSHCRRQPLLCTVPSSTART